MNTELIDKAISNAYNLISNIRKNSDDSEPIRARKEQQVELLKVVVDALEKQIPRKVTYHGWADDNGVFYKLNWIDGVPHGLCPVCEADFGKNKRKKFCPECGQKIIWGE